jgi:type IV pilus assembly protein PilE
MRHARGFTLIELMVTLTVAAIVATMAVSSYRSSVMRAHRTEATAALLNISAAQEKFFLQNNRYASDAERVAAPPGGLGIANPDGYVIRVISPDLTRGYTLSATATAGQADDHDCSTFTLAQNGLRGATDLGGADKTQDCWR